MKEMVRAIFAAGLTVQPPAARPAPGPPLALPTTAVHPAGQNDPQAPRRDPRSPPAELEQRSGRSDEQQGQTDRPPGVRIPLRPSRARARSPHLRTSHTYTPTRTRVRLISPTIMLGEPDLVAFVAFEPGSAQPVAAFEVADSALGAGAVAPSSAAGALRAGFLAAGDVDL